MTRKVGLLGFTACTVLLCAAVGQAQYGSGSGTEEDPYQISLPEHLDAMHYHSEDWDKHFILTSNINMSDYTYTKAVLGYGTIDSHKRFQGSPWIGVLDGNGYSIYNLTVAGEKYYIGLIGFAGESSIVRNVRLEGVNIGPGLYYVSGGIGENNGEIINCSVSGTVRGMKNTRYLGGLVGKNNGYMYRCHSESSITSFYGWDCFCVGGLVGWNTGNIIECSSSVEVSGVVESGIGGLAGSNSHRIERSFSSGSVSTTDWVGLGGLVGTNQDNGVITDCYNSTEVNGPTWSSGGLVGSNYSIIANCYSSGRTSGNGLIGYDRGGVYSCYWDVESSGANSSWAGEAKTTLEMRQLQTFLSWGSGAWRLDEGSDYPRLAWEETQGELIPHYDYAPGSGSQEDPFQISTAEQFGWIAQTSADWDKRFILVDDITFGECSLDNLIGWFNGTFDGNGHQISGLILDTGEGEREDIGLFRKLGPESVLSRLHLVDVTLSCGSEQGPIGGLVGYNEGGTILACSITGLSGSGGSPIGGLVGYNNSGTISACSFTGSIRSNSSVGGLVGINQGGTVIYSQSSAILQGRSGVGGLLGTSQGGDPDGLIQQCIAHVAIQCDDDSDHLGGLLGRVLDEVAIENSYVTGFITGGTSVGGVVGGVRNGSVLITRCYSTCLLSGKNSVSGLIGKRGTVQASYWDYQTAGVYDSTGGEGKSTQEMQNIQTYLDGGWDIIGDANSISSTWMMLDGIGYPRLCWEGVYVAQTILVRSLADKSVQHDISLTNMSEETIPWMIEADDLPDGINMEPMEGILHPGVMGTILITVPGGLPNNYYDTNIRIVNMSTHTYSTCRLIILVLSKEGNLSVTSNGSSIQNMINWALDGDVIVVEPGTYDENIDFKGKMIHLRSIAPDDPAIVSQTVLTNKGRYDGPIIRFAGNEEPNSILEGFSIVRGYNITGGGGIFGNGTHATIRNCMIRENSSGRLYYYDLGAGIYDCDGLIKNCLITDNNTSEDGGGLARCDGVIRNCTIVNNIARDNGGGLFECNAEIVNCIITNNEANPQGDQLYNCSVPTYSCYPGADGTNGNIDYDPLFADSGFVDANDTPQDPSDDHWVSFYQLKSEYGRWNPVAQEWVYDDVTSPCIDASDPTDPGWQNELWPHGGRINMGAYGGTPQAGMSSNPMGNIADLDHDDTVGIGDLSLFADDWLQWQILLDTDLDRNNRVNLFDLAILAENWLRP